MDREAIEYHVLGLLKAIGEDPDREGLKETPARVARMLEEVLEGTAYTNHQIAEMFGKTFDADYDADTDSAVVMKDITVFSYCEHHIALMYDMRVSVSYIPCGKVIGLSKIPRIVDAVCKRLQLQERIGNDICEIIQLATGSKDVRVEIDAKHSCVTARGIKKDSTTHTVSACGKLKDM